MELQELTTILNNRLRTNRDLFVHLRETGKIENITEIEKEIVQTEETLEKLKALL